MAELELQRNDIKRNLDEINQKMESTTAAVDEYSEKQRHIMELKAKQSTIENAAIETLTNSAGKRRSALTWQKMISAQQCRHRKNAS